MQFPPSMLLHPHIDDVIAIKNQGPRCDLVEQSKKIIVGVECGNSVLRGADVFIPGVLGAPKGKCSTCNHGSFLCMKYCYNYLLQVSPKEIMCQCTLILTESVYKVLRNVSLALLCLLGMDSHW